MLQNNPTTGLLFLVGIVLNLTHPMLVHPGAMIQTGLQAPAGSGAVGLTAANLANALFREIAEVFLQDDLWTGVVFAIAILVNSRTCFVFALLGSALEGMTALVLGADGAAIYHGLYGFNAALTGITPGACSWCSSGSRRSMRSSG